MCLNFYKRIKYTILVVMSLACGVYCNITSTCSQKEISTAYLDMAMDIIAKAKENIPTCNNNEGNVSRKAVDCADLLRAGQNRSGVYEIWPMSRVTEKKSLLVYCDMETSGGGWTVLQRRGDFQGANDSFFRDWKSYKDGFGGVEKDFWLGNDNIFALSNQKLYSVRFDLKDVKGNRRYALYEKFWIDDETHNYTLHISDFSGDAGDSMGNHNNQKFSTKDQDNDSDGGRHCSELFKGGWWYNKCIDSNLNGLYLKGNYSNAVKYGVEWTTWTNFESLEWTEIKIRPKNF